MIARIADAVGPSVFYPIYHAATCALIDQHGGNLLCIGMFIVVGSVFIRRGSARWPLFAAIVRGSGTPLPDSFDHLPQRAAHGVIAICLVALIALHVVAAIYHQFILRDGLLRRMWFGKRS